MPDCLRHMTRSLRQVLVCATLRGERVLTDDGETWRRVMSVVANMDVFDIAGSNESDVSL